MSNTIRFMNRTNEMQSFTAVNSKPHSSVEGLGTPLRITEFSGSNDRMADLQR